MQHLRQIPTIGNVLVRPGNSQDKPARFNPTTHAKTFIQFWILFLDGASHRRWSFRMSILLCRTTQSLKKYSYLLVFFPKTLEMENNLLECSLLRVWRCLITWLHAYARGELLVSRPVLIPCSCCCFIVAVVILDLHCTDCSCAPSRLSVLKIKQTTKTCMAIVVHRRVNGSDWVS